MRTCASRGTGGGLLGAKARAERRCAPPSDGGGCGVLHRAGRGGKVGPSCPPAPAGPRRRAREAFLARATGDEPKSESTPPSSSSSSSSSSSPWGGILDIDLSFGAINVGLGALWLAFAIYAFKFAPNAASVTDKTLLQAAINMGVDEDGVSINRVFFALFNVMGLWPVVYASLLLPTGRSGNKVPAWPFVSLSMFFGAFALLPYFALWEPMNPSAVYAKAKSEPSRVANFLGSKVNGLLVLCGMVFLAKMAVTAPASDWSGFASLFGKSRFTHVMSLDFLILTTMAPFWIIHDAELRKWKLG